MRKAPASDAVVSRGISLNVMHEEDLKAIYQFIRYLGQAGEPAPAYLPPDQEPDTPYALFPPAPDEKGSGE